MDESMTDELADFLSGIDREGAYRVERTLKESPAETTELVYFAGGNGSELGPFVRKRIDMAAGGGAAYESLWKAQSGGARFSHLPRLVECHRVGEQLTVVMEHVAGETLAERVAREGASPELAASLGPALCDAVAELHGSFRPPIIHRDLKPSNIILSGASGECPVIIDFGIARRYRADAEADTMRFGTRGYAAPEQFGFGQSTVRTDVYALGMLILFLCTGDRPVVRPDGEALARAGATGPLARVIEHACAFDPDARFASADEMGRAIRAAAEDIAERPGLEGPKPSDAFSPGDDFVRAENEVPAADAFSSGTCASRATKGRVNREASIRPSGLKASGDCGFASVIAALLRSMPAKVGRVWNALLAAAAVMIVAASIDVVLHPTGDIADSPLWDRACIAALVVIPESLLLPLLLADRRRWRRELPLVGAVTAGVILKAILIVGVVGLSLLVLIETVAGR